MSKKEKAAPIRPMGDSYLDYLRDESRIQGQAETISFPETEADVQEIVNTLSPLKTPITVQGSRTGISGRAVPLGGHILNLSAMNRITGLDRDDTGRFSIHVQPGICLSDLNRQVMEKRFATQDWDAASLALLEDFKASPRLFWPPDPSEKTASVGGIAASSARGSCAFGYGPTSRYIKSLRMIDAAGVLHRIPRGRYCFSKGVCPLPGGGELQIEPGHPGPDQRMDLIDLVLGSQGMLGVITGLELILEPLPKEIWGIVFFFANQSRATGFIRSLLQGKKSGTKEGIVAIEFMDHATLKRIQQFKQLNTRLAAFPDIAEEFESAVSVELHNTLTDALEAEAETLMAAAAAWECDLDKTWAFCNANEMERFHCFGHAAPEAVNARVDAARQTDPRITKCYLDLQLEQDRVDPTLARVQKDLKERRLQAAIFGHAGDGLFQIHFLPEDYPQYARAMALVEEWAGRNPIATAHDPGRAGPGLFRSLPLHWQMEMQVNLKARLDPHGIWNPGNRKNEQVSHNFKNKKL